MTQKTPSNTRAPLSPLTRNVLAGGALLLPSLTLVPLGGLYLWEHGLLLWWAGGALAVVLLLSLALRRALQPAARVRPEAGEASDEGADPHWSDLEAAAWRDVREVAVGVDVDQMSSGDYFVALGQTTLNVVAKRLHPEKTDAMWQFTLPEALAIVERVSRRLGGFVVQSVPFGDRLTVAQLLAAYRWRGMFDVAERAYDIWRILRIVNPATAITNEARERLSRAVYNYGKEHVARRIAEAFVEEVGRAAIDLYGGRLLIAQKLQAEPPPQDQDPLRELANRPVTVNVAVGGGSRSDRLALASLIAEATDKFGVSARAAPDGTLTTAGDPLPLRAGSADYDEVADELAQADILVWIVTLEGAEDDALALAQFAAKSRAEGHASLPVFLPVSLIGAADDAPAIKDEIARATALLSQGLGIRAPAVITVPDLDVAPQSAVAPVAAAVVDRLGMGRRVHVLRIMGQARRSRSWSKSARQAAKAAGALTRAVFQRRAE